jgi:hypothetical protein
MIFLIIKYKIRIKRFQKNEFEKELQDIFKIQSYEIKLYTAD